MFERGRRRSISVASDRCVMHDAEIERGRIQDSREISLFSGPPPADWSTRLGPPPPGASGAEVREVLVGLVRASGGSARLHYSSLTGCRKTVSDLAEAPVREIEVWAVTGWLGGAAGAPRVPVGWSGRGTGLAWLRALPAEWLRAQLEAAARAVPVVPGTGPAVLSPAAAAVLLHEAAGHAAEASPSGASLHRLGRRIASELVSVVDDPRCDGGPSRYDYDDENVRSLGPTGLVREGVLIQQLHSTESARGSWTLPTGNARAASAWVPPIPRVSNIVCAPGESSEDELLSRMGDGLYIHRLSDGISGTGKIQARIVLAEQVCGGRRTGQLLGSGRIEEDVDVLHRVIGVANNGAFSSNAMCGRAGQLLFDVGTSAPSLQLSSLRIAA